jgi:glutathione S-transferase
VDVASFPNLYRWWERINARPAVQKGTSVPSESRITNAAYQRRLKEEPDFKKQEDNLKDLGEKAKQEYNYKYSSP